MTLLIHQLYCIFTATGAYLFIYYYILTREKPLVDQ